MSGFATRFILLIAGHALCDYPLQGDFLARGKNHKAPLSGVPWYQCLIAHAMIHAGMVLLITHSPWLAIAELVIHSLTDYAKCAGWFGSSLPANLSPQMQRILGMGPANRAFNIDQAIHYGCKLLWALLS